MDDIDREGGLHTAMVQVLGWARQRFKLSALSFHSHFHLDPTTSRQDGLETYLIAPFDGPLALQLTCSWG